MNEQTFHELYKKMLNTIEKREQFLLEIYKLFKENNIKIFIVLFYGKYVNDEDFEPPKTYTDDQMSLVCTSNSSSAIEITKQNCEIHQGYTCLDAFSNLEVFEITLYCIFTRMKMRLNNFLQKDFIKSFIVSDEEMEIFNKVTKIQDLSF